jgi:hypothetical protein
MKNIFLLISHKAAFTFVVFFLSMNTIFLNAQSQTIPKSLEVKALSNKWIFQNGTVHNQVQVLHEPMNSLSKTDINIISFTCTPTSIMAGQTATLTPLFENATSAFIVDASYNVINNIVSGGTYPVTPSSTGTYELIVDGTGGERVTRTVTVIVHNGHKQFLQQGPKLVATDAIGNAQQGRSVAISADGKTAIIGGYNDNSPIGAAWVWRRNGENWIQGPKLIGSGVYFNPQYPRQTIAIAADGNAAIIANSSTAQIWTRNGEVWSKQGPSLAPVIPSCGSLSCQYLYAVSLSADGNTAILGGRYDDANPGAVGGAWIFTRNGNSWTQQGHMLIPIDAGGDVNDITSVALSADGNTCILGGMQDNNYVGAAWVWTRIGGGWTQQGPKLVGSGAVGGANNGNGTAGQGYSVSLSADGNTAIVGGNFDGVLPSNNTGAVWIWTRSGGVWTQQGPKLVGPGGVSASTVQGFSVSLSADGNTALVGGAAGYSQTSSALVWTRSGGVWTHQGTKLIGSGAVGSGNGQQPAVSVSLSADGNTALVGGYGDNGGAGAVWVFTSVVAAPTVTTLAASNVTINSATINGTVNPNGTSTTYYFEYGTTINYGNTTAQKSAGTGFTNLSDSAAISGLITGQTYHFRIVATNTGGTVYGNDLTFVASMEYVLKRVVNNTTEIFSLNKHIWNFTNSLNNMWPQNWWEQFDYSDNLYPLAWRWLAKPSDFPDWPLFVSVFGQDQCYLNPPPDVVIYNPKASLKWFGMKTGWGGSCFGFAISSFLFFDQKLSLSTLFPGYQDIFSVPNNNDSRKLINLYWIYQFGKEQLAHIQTNYRNTPVQTLTEIKDMFLDSQRNDRILVFFNQNGSGGHAVNPYKVNVGQLIDTIYIYDNNAPNQKRQIYINKDENSWNYPNMAHWGGKQGLFLMDPVSNYLTNPILPKQLPSKEKYISDKLTNNNFIEIYNSFNSNVTIKNVNGDSIAFKMNDGKIYSNMQDGIPIIPITGNEHPPIGYYIPKNSYSLELNSLQDTSMYVSFINDSLAYSVNRNNTLQTDREKFSFESNNHKLEIINSENNVKNYDVNLIRTGNEAEKVVEINNLEMLSQDLLKFTSERNDKFKIENVGGNKNYNLSIRIASVSGESTFEHSNIFLPANSSQTMQQKSENVTIYIDNGNNGTIDDSVNVVNQYTGINNGKETIPTEFRLFQNYPNPFNPNTTINYSIPNFSFVTIKVFDIMGRLIQMLVDEEKAAGNYSVIFNGSNLASGIYFYRMQAGDFIETKKLILLK